MYAVLKTGGKQYRVAVGDVLKVESLPAQAGDTVELDQVLMITDGDEVKVGSPFIAGTTVTATVRGHGRGPKIRIFKMRRRKHSSKQAGHRQNYTELEITSIAGKSTRPAAKAKVAPKKSTGAKAA